MVKTIKIKTGTLMPLAEEGASCKVFTDCSKMRDVTFNVRC
jgi:hypothetical protein